MQQQNAMRERMQNMMTNDPLSFMRDLTEQNLAIWKEMQEGFVKATMPSAGTRARKSKRSKERTSQRKP